MTPRSIRRAAERKALEAARKIAVPDTGAFDEPTCPESRLAANRANAQLSPGPRTPEGKSISSLNAVKTGLTGRTVVLPSDDAVIYERHILDYENEYQPEGLRERELVQSLADTAWRLQRITRLEAALYAQGYLDFANAFENQHPDLRRGMIELEAYLKYEKVLRNLQLQECRLHRRYEREVAELRNLQKERQAEEEPMPTFIPATQTEPRTSVSDEPASDQGGRRRFKSGWLRIFHFRFRLQRRVDRRHGKSLNCQRRSSRNLSGSQLTA